ncbi:MAG: vacuolar iron transporter family protein [Acidobacteriota bacterium]|jgi:VIT1/CCC1 family predicted Fe2+/Mn2+ transporter|nr:vacuolar iron transporter family protein [Acidobacteriota bacterium]
MEHEHTAEAIRTRLAAGPRLSYLRDWIYGGIDGSVTTFAVVTGVIGADLAPAIIVILGVANLLGDGFSMAASNYLGTRTERQEIEALHAQETRHIAVAPEGEREEVRQIFAAKGFTGDDLERAVSVVTSDRERWIRFMLSEEFGLPLQVRSASTAALSTFSAFIICGLVPLLPFLLPVPHPFAVSVAMTLAVFFAVGSARSRWLAMSWWRAGIETLIVGGIAATLAWAAGVFIARLVR